MIAPRFETIVGVAFANTAEVRGWRVMATREDGEHIKRTLRNLVHLGHVASFSVRSGGGGSFEDLVGELRSRVGDLQVDICLAAGEPSIDPPPSFLMPIWAFDHVIEGAPASTGRLLGLNLELIATPSFDEEFGAHLPGHSGRWLIRARPMF